MSATDVPEFGEGKLVSEADNLMVAPGTDPDAQKFMDQRSNMLDNIKDGGKEDEDKDKVLLIPMSPLAASATVSNLLLATGPFA